MDRGHRALLILLAGSLCGGASALSAAPPATPSVQATPASTASPKSGPPGASELPGRGRIRAAMMDAHEPALAESAAVAERLARMTPEERETFKRNLHTWQQLPPEERQAVRKLANERNREEILNALRESGLQLNDDQREVFALRYLQERRKLERDIQEQAATERARRLPQILSQLKREFVPEKAAPSPVSGVSPASR